MARVFVSYRHVEPDMSLAQRLATAFEDSGHQVFIDSRIPLGMLWGEVIDRELAGSDYVVALISETAAVSPMVITEIAEAHRLNVEHGRPSIIPIRLGDELRLRYPLSAYVSRFQHTTWTGPADTDELVQQLLAA